LRLIENRWVSSESTFVPTEWFDRCVDDDLHPLLEDPRQSAWVGVDASVKRDSTAIVAAAFIEGKVRLIWHRIFQPSPNEPLDFEATIERSLMELRRRFWVREVRYDPYQLVAVAQRLTAAGLPMIEFPQSVPNLTESSTNLFELIKGQNLSVYADDDIRLAISRCVALETTRGWRIAKEKTSHKIDVIVALAMAALGAVQQGQAPTKFEYRTAPQPQIDVYGSGTSGGRDLSPSELERRGLQVRPLGHLHKQSARGRALRWF
jgi:phage terminase large subunit-like protein